MTRLNVSSRGSDQLLESSYQTHFQAQMALDQIIQDHARARRLVVMRIANGRVRWEVHDEAGEVCNCWLSV